MCASSRIVVDNLCCFLANLGGKAAFVWFGLCLFSFIWIWIEVPETKGKTADELDTLFAEGRPAWRFLE